MEHPTDYRALYETVNDLLHQEREEMKALTRKLADAQATVEALQAIIKQMGEQACVLAKDGMAAKVQVEALQRERDHAKNMAAVQKEVADNQTWHVRELTAALDAEREKVKGLHEATKVICGHCCEPMEIPSKAVLQSQLSALQGLVRAISETMEPFRLSLAKLDEVDTLATRRIAEADAYYCAQRVLSTLPATPTESGEDHSGDDTDMVQKGGGDGE